MPLKILPDDSPRLGRSITKKQTQQLVDKCFDMTGKKLGPVQTHIKMKKDKDSRCCHFMVSEIENLLKENKYYEAPNKEDWGLRLYYGYHHPDNDFEPDNRRYYNQHTIIIVVTEKIKGMHEDKLTDKHFISLADGGDGLDNGTLCPPDCDGGEKIG